MTMHLLGPAFTTTNTKKKKSKPQSYSKYAKDWVDYNKHAKRLGYSTKTYEEYVSYRKGNYKPKLRGVKTPKLEVSNHRSLYPSQSEIGVAFAKKPNTYTGDKLLGIATMHKSNMVSIFSQEEAEEVARMRRG